MWSLQMMACSLDAFKMLTGASDKPVAGVGDEARWDHDILTVRKGAQCFMAPGRAGERSLDIAKTLAQEASDHMGRARGSDRF